MPQRSVDVSTSYPIVVTPSVLHAFNVESKYMQVAFESAFSEMLMGDDNDVKLPPLTVTSNSTTAADSRVPLGSDAVGTGLDS